MNGTESAIRLLSRLVPVGPPALLQSRIAASVESSALLVTPECFAKFFLALSFIGTAGVLAGVVATQGLLVFPIIGGSVVLGASPVLLLTYRIQSRRRSTDGELPFFALLLFILSFRSFADLPEAFERTEQLGPGVFPAFCKESGLLRRNLAYSVGPQTTTVERTFMFHPSRHLRELVHGYQTTLSSGRDVHEFVRDEADRLLAVHEEKWRSFAAGLSSMTEVSFLFLAIFPVGLQMVAGGFAGGRSSSLLGLATLVLVPVAAALMLWMDASQPPSRDTPLPGRYFAALVAATCAILFLCYLNAMPAIEAAATLLAFTVAYVLKSRRFFRSLRAGEDDVAAMLHDLAELTRSGVELPRALSRLLEDSSPRGELGENLATFSFLLSLGRTPVAAQAKAAHPSWLVRLSFALLAVAFETGAGYEQLERLSSSFRRISDSRSSVRASVLPFAALGVAVPALSAASFWFLRSMLALSPGFQSLVLSGSGAGASESILACTVLTGLLVSKAHSQSVRNVLGVPPLLASALVSLLFFGSP